jgi:hypothetical protein
MEKKVIIVTIEGGVMQAVHVSPELKDAQVILIDFDELEARVDENTPGKTKYERRDNVMDEKEAAAQTLIDKKKVIGVY